MNTKLDLKYLGKPIKITGYNFAKPVLKLFNDIKFPDRTLRLAGTAGFKVLSLFASDIDLF